MLSVPSFTFMTGYLYELPKRMFPFLETHQCKTVKCQLLLVETRLALLLLLLLSPLLLYYLLRLFAYCCGAMFAVFGVLKSFWRADALIEAKPTPHLEQKSEEKSQSRRCCDHCKRSSTRVFYRISRRQHLYCQRCYLDYCDIMTCKCPECPQLHHIVCYVCMSAEAE